MEKIGRNELCPCSSGKKFKRCCGAVKTSPPVRPREEIRVIQKPSPGTAGVIISEASKTKYEVRDTIVVNQLRRDALAVGESFDKLCDNDLHEISRLFSESAVYIYAAYVESYSRPDSLQHAESRLLSNAGNTLIAAIGLLRNGFILQPGILLRSVFENISVALHLRIEPDDLDVFRAGKLDSTRTINAAKKLLPPFGYLYGFLSQEFVHIGKLYVEPNYLMPYSERHEAVELNLTMIRVVTWFLYVATEFICFDKVQTPRYFRKLGAGKYAYDPSDEERIWMDQFLKEAKVAMRRESEVQSDRATMEQEPNGGGKRKR